MQFILTSDGDVSFAIFIHEGTSGFQVDSQIGFDAGNQEDYIIIKDIDPVQQRSTFVYRIDG